MAAVETGRVVDSPQERKAAARQEHPGRAGVDIRAGDRDSEEDEPEAHGRGRVHETLEQRREARPADPGARGEVLGEQVAEDGGAEEHERGHVEQCAGEGRERDLADPHGPVAEEGQASHCPEHWRSASQDVVQTRGPSHGPNVRPRISRGIVRSA